MAQITKSYLHQSLLSDLSANISTAKRTYHHDKINNSPNTCMLFKTFSSLIWPPSSTLATFFINKVTNLTAQFSTPQSILSANIQSFTSFSALSEADVSKLSLSSHPTTCPLDPIPSNLLQAISPAVDPALTHIVNTSLHTGVLNPTLLGNYRPVSLLPFISKTLWRVVLNQVTAFLTQNNLLDRNQSGFSKWTFNWNCLALSCWRSKTCQSGFQVFITYIGGSVRWFWYGQPPDPPVNPIEKGHLRNRTPVVWLLPLRYSRSLKLSWRGDVSKSQHLATGVPQGSVLGPLLFFVYMAFRNMAFHITAMLMTLDSTSHPILRIPSPSTQPS